MAKKRTRRIRKKGGLGFASITNGISSAAASLGSAGWNAASTLGSNAKSYVANPSRQYVDAFRDKKDGHGNVERGLLTRTFKAAQNRNKFKFGLHNYKDKKTTLLTEGYVDIVGGQSYRDFLTSLKIDCDDDDYEDVIQIRKMGLKSKTDKIIKNLIIAHNFDVYVNFDAIPDFARNVAAKLIVEYVMKKGNMSTLNKYSRKAFAGVATGVAAVGALGVGLAGVSLATGFILAGTPIQLLGQGFFRVGKGINQVVKQKTGIDIGTWTGRFVKVVAAIAFIPAGVVTGFAGSVVLQIVLNFFHVGGDGATYVKSFFEKNGTATVKNDEGKVKITVACPDAIVEKKINGILAAALDTGVIMFFISFVCGDNEGKKNLVQRLVQEVEQTDGNEESSPTNYADASRAPDPFPSFVHPSSSNLSSENIAITPSSPNTRPRPGEVELQTFKSKAPEVSDFDPVDNRKSALEKLRTSGYSEDELNYVGMQNNGCDNFAQCKEKADYFRKTLIGHLTSTGSKVPLDVATEVVNRGCGGYDRCATAAREVLTKRDVSQGSTRFQKPLFPENALSATVGAKREVRVPKGLFDDPKGLFDD